jgi:hypothetical protein
MRRFVSTPVLGIEGSHANRPSLPRTPSPLRFAPNNHTASSRRSRSFTRWLDHNRHRANFGIDFSSGCNRTQLHLEEVSGEFVKLTSPSTLPISTSAAYASLCLLIRFGCVTPYPTTFSRADSHLLSFLPPPESVDSVFVKPDGHLPPLFDFSAVGKEDAMNHYL